MDDRSRPKPATFQELARALIDPESAPGDLSIHRIGAIICALEDEPSTAEPKYRERLANSRIARRALRAASSAVDTRGRALAKLSRLADEAESSPTDVDAVLLLAHEVSTSADQLFRNSLTVLLELGLLETHGMKRRGSAEAGRKTGKGQRDRNKAIYDFFHGEIQRGVNSSNAAKSTAKWLAERKLPSGWRVVGWKQIRDIVKAIDRLPPSGGEPDDPPLEHLSPRKCLECKRTFQPTRGRRSLCSIECETLHRGRTNDDLPDDLDQE